MKRHTELERYAHRVWQRKGLISTALLPLSWLVNAVVARKRRRYMRDPSLTYHSHVPVIVVGNVYVGGTGKTPVVIALAQALQKLGWQPGIISRGYGVDLGDRARSGKGELNPELFGDEPAVIARETACPVAVHPRRSLAARRLLRQYPDVDVIISDDGLQHLALGRDLEIAVQDVRGVGNGRILPAGPLREPATRLEYVDFLITHLLPDETPPAHASTPAHQLSMQLRPARMEQIHTGVDMPWPEWLMRHGTSDVAAMAGIGRPERFFGMLNAGGLPLAERIALPDHASFQSSPFDRIAARAILITAKDAVKCGKWADERVWVVHPQPTFSDPDWTDHVHELLTAIAARKAALAQVPDSV